MTHKTSTFYRIHALTSQRLPTMMKKETLTPKPLSTGALENRISIKRLHI